MGIIAAILFSFFVFFFPIGVVNNAMSKSKKSTLKEICNIYLEIYQVLMKDIETNTNHNTFTEKKEVLEVLDNLYTKAERMPVWPFDLRTLTSFLAVTCSPLIMIVL